MDLIKTEQLQSELIRWFCHTGRPLPWRRTYDPYHIWISEIMLQQTRMDRGILYFDRWIQRFPDIASVAAADEREILKLWEGLGYYARARNLHAAAKVITEQYKGEIPCDTKELLALPGIGPYTAAAICSIAYNLDIPVVDANVMRVYCRLFDIDGPIKSGEVRRQIEGIAAAMLPAGRARVFNQALMDFGGMVCLPRAPRCGACPVRRQCRAFLSGTVPERPAAVRRDKTIVIEMATGVLRRDGRLFIQQRTADDIWGGLWEFPGGRIEPGELPENTLVREYLEETGFQIDICRHITTVTHFYTRYKVVLHCFGCRLRGELKDPVLTAAQDYRWILPQDLKEYGFPAGHRKLLDYIFSSCPELLDDPCLQ